MSEASSHGSDSDPDHTHTSAPDSHGGRSIGHYRLLQKLGEGGMGEVWLAEQTRPVHRQVAFKVIKPGMDSAQVIARFEAERQALALMAHPAIATVLDGGTTPEGRPYFAMEYVKGEPITTYCDRHRLSMAERLALFLQVCEGAQHAHQKGIIHRDLKPSNVLVTIHDDHPVPKIIDFGVAKATAQPLTEHSLFTELGVMIGTPEYMSPEQAEMGALDIDTRTDIYALGVLLYELLTGALPLDRKDLRAAGLDEIRRTIREKDPPKPSTRVTQMGPASAQAAQNRHTEAKRLASQLRGDLDWITMKALEKDRTRRYDTVMGLANDVLRHLRNEPVMAGPPSASYRASKFVRRHRFGVTTAVGLVLLLVVFAMTMVVQAQRIARERDRASNEAMHASQQAEAARQVTAFMIGLFRVSDPEESRGSTITAREVLDRGVDRIDKELGDQPDIQTRLMSTMGDVYAALGLYQRSEGVLRKALEVRKKLWGPRDPRTLESLHSLGALLAQQGRAAEAEGVAHEALQGRRVVLGPDHPDTLKSLTSLTAVFYAQGKWADAEAGFREVLTARERTLGQTDEHTLAAVSNLAAVLQVQNKNRQAEKLYQRALAGLLPTVGRDHPTTLTILYNLGTLAERQGHWPEADAYYAEVFRVRQRVFGADHADTLDSAVALANVRRLQGRLSDAEALVRDALERARHALPPPNEITAGGLVTLGTLLNTRQQYNEARPLLQEAVELRRTMAPGALEVAEAQCALGESFRGLREYRAAEPLLVGGCGEVLGSIRPPNTLKREAAARVVALYSAWGKPEKAKEWQAKLAAQTPQ